VVKGENGKGEEGRGKGEVGSEKMEG